MLVGELASLRGALRSPSRPPLAVPWCRPSLFIAVVGTDGPAARGWGVPIATDIAFALGVLALLGRRVPIGLRIFVDRPGDRRRPDRGLVIAVFYTADLVTSGSLPQR